MDTIGPCQQDMRSHPGPWNPRACRVPASYARAGVDQPLEAIFFTGILNRLTGGLSLMPPGVVDPPTSARVGMS